MAESQKRIAESLNALWEYLHYLLPEFLNKWNYFNSAIIGTSINLLSGTKAVIPYAVPFFVQSFIKSANNYRNRYNNTLVLLPGQRDDPSFVMDLQGCVVLSAGKTKRLFSENSIANIEQFIGKRNFRSIIRNLEKTGPNGETGMIEAWSPVTKKWYEVKTNPVDNRLGLPGNLLVWFSDITRKREYDLRLRDLLKYTGDLNSNIRRKMRTESQYDDLAAYILANYEAVFITRTDENGNLAGNVFKHGKEGTKRSEPITIEKESRSPVFISRRKSTVVADTKNNYPSAGEFERKYPFDPRVREFVGPIRNFVNYHEADVSIIAFNSKTEITDYEKNFIEALVNLARSVVALVDLARENDEQFLQKVMGLCAAAEYSEEITGKHVVRVNAYSEFIAGKLGLDPDFVETVGQVAALHDIGKVAIPELIRLNRMYSREERLSMQMHTIHGACIIETMMTYAKKKDPRLVIARNIALHHHQLYNGQGYPNIKKSGKIIEPRSKNYEDYLGNDPLTGDEIPIEGLIAGLADRYDALRGGRGEKYSHERSVKIMSRDDRTGVCGEDWHGPDIWRVFLEHHSSFDRIFEEMK